MLGFIKFSKLIYRLFQVKLMKLTLKNVSSPCLKSFHKFSTSKAGANT